MADHNLLAGIRGVSTDYVAGSHNLSGVAPGFVNAAGDDYHLLSGSPLLDVGAASFTPAFSYAGAITAAPAVDHDVLSRPRGAGIELGALERTP